MDEIVPGVQIIAQIPGEMREFMEWLKGRDIRSVLDIGMYEGGTCACWKALFPDAYVLGTDIGDGTQNVQLGKLKEMYGFETLLGCDSHDPETLRKLEGRKFDFLFIDGDHSYEGVKKDFEMYGPLVEKGGIVAFHDIKDTQHHRDINVFVPPFWKEIKEKYPHREFVDDSVGWGGIGVLFL